MGEIDNIPLALPDINDDEIRAVEDVLRSGRLSIGPRLQSFEATVARRANRKYGIGVNSGTSGLHLCVRALGIEDGDEVITTPFSFIATANCVLFERARPVFVDIDPETYNLDPHGIAGAITPRTKALLPVEVFGNTAHFDEYERIAREHGLKMIEDCCEALGGTLAGRPAGNFGECSVFAFYPNKQITTGEGGMIVTDNPEIYELCNSMRNQGRSVQEGFVHEVLGYNYRLNEISAVLGDLQMARLDEILQQRRNVAAAYADALSDIEEIHLPRCADNATMSWFVYVIRLAEPFNRESRSELVRLLNEQGIHCERYFHPIHLTPLYRRKFGYHRGQFPICESIADRTVALPFFTTMTEEQIRRVAEPLKEILPKIRPSTSVAVPATPTVDADSDIKPQRVPFFRVICDGNERKYLEEVLNSGWLTTASKAFELEKRFARIVGARHARAVNSCTAALHLAMEATGVTEGMGVFVPTMTFTATAEVVRYMGAEPILLDVEYGSSLITPEILRDGIRRHPNVKHLAVVHFGGQPAEMLRANGEGICDICREHGIRIIEDAAHAFPAKVGGQMIGSVGDVTCFSFYANKTMTSGEGGMLTTDDDEIAQRVSVMRLHGIDHDVWDRFTSDAPHWEYDVVAPGYKYNMPDINAAVGLAQLERYEALWRQRLRCVRYYYNRLADVPEIDLPVCHEDLEDHAWHLFVVIVNKDAPVSRNALIELLAERGVSTSVHYKPLHRMSYYRNRYRLSPEQFPEAEKIWSGCLSLPLFPTMTEEELETVCSTLIELLQKRL